MNGPGAGLRGAAPTSLPVLAYVHSHTAHGECAEQAQRKCSYKQLLSISLLLLLPPADAAGALEERANKLARKRKKPQLTRSPILITSKSLVIIDKSLLIALALLSAVKILRPRSYHTWFVSAASFHQTSTLRLGCAKEERQVYLRRPLNLAPSR